MITLRPFELSDVDDFMVWATDDRVSRYCRWDSFTSREQALTYMKNKIMVHPWSRAICLDNKPVGRISVKPHSGNDKCRADLSYVVAFQYWGKGIATKAVKSALEAVFSEWPHLERVEALVEVENIGSQRVMEKAGLKREGVLRKYFMLKGSTRDVVVYSFLLTDAKELAKQSMVTLPPRYIRDDQDPPVITLNPSISPTIPVIDLQKLLYGDSQESELELFNSAAKEWGFFQLVNHGVDSTLVESVKQEIQQFYQLPLEQKTKFWQQENEIEGFGQAFIMSDVQKLDWADMFFITTLPIHARKPHLFPELPLPLRNTLEAYSVQLNTIATKILQMTEKALKTELGEITELFEDGNQSMRVNYYPPCPQPEQAIGLTAHSDVVALTIVLQVNEMEGLQVRNEGMWIPIKPLPNAFIVNIGDMLEIITNGMYRSIEHRATVNKEKERLSVVAFHTPRFNAEIGPSKSLVAPHAPAMYKRTTVKDFYDGYLERKLDGKSYIEVVKIGKEKDN